MKVLILTYYWPPAGGSGVQRWLKFVKYLPEFNITPVVFTVDDPNYPKQDQSLCNEVSKDLEVIKNPIWEPTDLFFWKSKNHQKKEVSNATNNGFLSFVRGNFFIPDPKIFWVNSSVKVLDTYLKNHKVDVIISTGPPHSVHLIAKKLKEKHHLQWLADFRDPWSELYYQKEFKQLSFAKKRNKQLELSVLKAADCVVTVSNTLKKSFLNTTKKVAVITNGFDTEVAQNYNSALDNTFSISYIGLLPKQSNPKVFFKVLAKICNKDAHFKKELRLNFIGDISEEVKIAIQENKLLDKTNFIGYVSHQKAIEYQKKAQVLLLLIPNVDKSEGILTGKLFEYLTANRPILALSNAQGDLAAILKETKTGKVVHYNAELEIEKEILRLYYLYQDKKLQVFAKNVDQFHRKNLTKKLAELLNTLNS